MSSFNFSQISLPNQWVKAEVDLLGSLESSPNDAYVINYLAYSWIDKAAASGIAAIIQPGGSIRDEEVIAAADENNIAMVFTATRHFRH